jgi:hypothetical protein
MRKIFLWSWMVGLPGLLAFTGCQTAPGLSKLTITDDREINYNYKWPKPEAHFAAGEIPVVRVIGCEGKNITLQIINVSSEEIVFQHSGFFPKPAIKTEPDRIIMDHPYGLTDRPAVPVHSTQIDVSRPRLFFHLNHLSAGSYEAHLLVEGELVEKSFFTISN